MGNTKSEIKEQKQEKGALIVNNNILALDPSKLNKTSVEESLKKRQKNAQAWKSDCPDTLLTHTSGNGLVNAVHLAYSEHYNLELSPDDIWLAILQGFSAHLELNHEKLRKQFVDFEGQKELTIKRDHFVFGSNKNDWAGCFSEWCEQIKENIGDQNHKNLVPNFTSSTQISQACFNATLMDSMKHYFSFKCVTMCGIPQIRLTGTVEDWQKLKEQAQNLGQYDLEWWTQYLILILDKFIECKQGVVDKVFWNCIYKVIPPGKGSGKITTVTGWILNFFPYLNDGDKKVENQYLTSLKKIYKTYGSGVLSSDKGIMEKGIILGGITETPFKWEYLSSEFKMKIVAGFHNICYEGQFIKPAKGWAIVEDQQE